MNYGTCPNDGQALRKLSSGILHCPICPFNVPGNKKKLDTMYAWVSVDAEGREGFMAVGIGDHLMPLVHSELYMMQECKHIAIDAVKHIAGYHTRLIKFSNREIVEDCE